MPVDLGSIAGNVPNFAGFSTATWRFWSLPKTKRVIKRWLQGQQRERLPPADAQASQAKRVHEQALRRLPYHPRHIRKRERRVLT
jgi:hypothetical protein